MTDNKANAAGFDAHTRAHRALNQYARTVVEPRRKALMKKICSKEYAHEYPENVEELDALESRYEARCYEVLCQCQTFDCTSNLGMDS